MGGLGELHEAVDPERVFRYSEHRLGQGELPATTGMSETEQLLIQEASALSIQCFILQVSASLSTGHIQQHIYTSQSVKNDL